ncbi:MAG: hypothetical protein OHK0036_09770 [Bacteroidia bacterium]
MKSIILIHVFIFFYYNFYAQATRNFIRITTECCEKVAPDIYHLTFIDKNKKKSPFTYPSRSEIIRYIDIYIDSFQIIKIMPSSDTNLLFYRFLYNDDGVLTDYEIYKNNKLDTVINLYDSTHKIYLEIFLNYFDIINRRFDKIENNENFEFDEYNRLIEERRYVNYRYKKNKRKKILQSCYNYYYIPIGNYSFILELLKEIIKERNNQK